MGDFEVLPSPLFEAEIKSISGEKMQISSQSIWSNVSVKEHIGYTEIIFSGHEKVEELCVLLEARKETDSIVWSVNVLSDSPTWSVMSINYPTPTLKHPEFNLFVPYFGGRTVVDAGNKGYTIEKTYPGTITMQYFAAYSEKYGVYLGVEDERGAVKNYLLVAENGVFFLKALFYAIGGGTVGNSFDVYGEMRWQMFFGDWYDASMIYADFVYKKAKWLPERTRPDTREKFKSIPFWISDYIPNIESQGNNKPMLLSAGSDIYEPEYWYKTPIELQKELRGVPIGYHVYNWHKIPFNRTSPL